MEYRMRQRNGQYGWWRDDGVPQYEEEAGFLGYIGSVTDVTERRRLEMATRDPPPVDQRAGRGTRADWTRAA